ncbi:MAG: hypothetical protein JW801_16535 [Bacteroidales bacterium]|nr:hypothetical protein [Bacteroidales bacterium]
MNEIKILMLKVWWTFNAKTTEDMDARTRNSRSFLINCLLPKAENEKNSREKPKYRKILVKMMNNAPGSSSRNNKNDKPAACRNFPKA